jgi:hypothetical protein
MDQKNKVEYRLEFVEDDYQDVQYFNTEDEAWDFIKRNQILTYNILKEEIIASRYEGK